MTALLVGHAVIGLVIALSARQLRRAAFAVGAVPMLLTLVYAAWHAGGVLEGAPVTEDLTWVGSLDLSVSLRLDGFGLLMTLVIAGIGVAVMAYGALYFPDGDRPARIAGLLVLFAGSMLGVVLADNVALLYVAWELTSVTSFLLIGGDHGKPEARAAALHALLVTGAGGLAMLGGLVLLAQEAGTWSLSGILEAAPSGTVAGAGLGLVAVGIVTKSAQYPFHAWLPAAMVAPTPVSAYLHSATMVKAGIYLAARLAPVFALTSAWRPMILTVGLVTMFGGGLRALRQNDLKLLLAMGTVSQLGFLLVLFGSGLPEATVAGCTMLIAHALFKATLFLVVGVIDHQAGTRDRRQLSGFGPGWGGVKIATVVAAASMAGLPPVLGFVAKEAALDAFAGEGLWGAVVLAGLVGGSALTAAYTVRFAVTVLARPAPEAVDVAAPAGGFVAPALVLTAFTVVGGLAVTPLLDPLVTQAASDLDADVHAAHLALWHGLGLPLLLSAVALGTGGLLVVGRERVAAALQAVAPRRGGAEGYAMAVGGLNAVARRTAAITQSGSLPIYVAVILMTAALTPGVVLVMRAGWPGWPELEENPLQLVVAILIGVTAVAAAVQKRRFAAVLLLGAVGYAMALTFVLHGAPDLALTQFAIETLTVVAFVLVLRFLPPDFHRRRPPLGFQVRVAVSAAVAAAVFGFAVLSNGARHLEPVSGGLIDRSLSEAGGRNVVNVVLVDFRGLDTLGEISVLVVAGLGVVALARVGRRRLAPGEERKS